MHTPVLGLLCAVAGSALLVSCEPAPSEDTSEKELTAISVECDAEDLTKRHQYFETSNAAYYLAGGNTQTEEKARSGKYSAKVSPQDQYTFTFRQAGWHASDIINVDVWRLGKDGAIVLSAHDGKIYEATDAVAEKDSTTGWERLHLTYVLPDSIKSYKPLSVYIFNGGKEASYFDDLKIDIRKQE